MLSIDVESLTHPLPGPGMSLHPSSEYSRAELLPIIIVTEIVLMIGRDYKITGI